MMLTPHSRYSGAAAMPAKLLCEASTATTLISSALEIGLAPGKRASGVCATTRPATVAIRIVQVVAESMSEVGSHAASHDEPAAASSARPSHSSTASDVVAPRAGVGATTMSALDVARVQRLNAGASRATENSTTTHIE